MVRRERRKEKMGIIAQLWHLCLPLTPMQIGRNVILPAPNSELGFKLRCPCLKFSLNRPDLQIPHFPTGIPVSRRKQEFLSHFSL